MNTRAQAAAVRAQTPAQTGRQFSGIRRNAASHSRPDRNMSPMPSWPSVGASRITVRRIRGDIKVYGLAAYPVVGPAESDDEEMSSEEDAAVREGLEDLRAGRVVTLAQLREELESIKRRA